MAITWNPADKSADIVLSNGNLTAGKNNTAWKSVRATESKSNGKWYFEVKITCSSGANVGVGVMQSVGGLETWVGADAFGWVFLGDGYNGNGGAFSSYGLSIVSNDVVMVAVDFDASKIWWGKNGSWFNSGDPSIGSNPAYTSVTGNIYPACSLRTSAETATARFLDSSFSYAVPVGFYAWGVVPVSLSGNCIKAGAGGADLVAIHDWTTRTLIETIIPDQITGAWAASIHAGQYSITYTASGCQPICHGPYVVS